MTKTEKAALSKLLAEIAARLDTAEDRAVEVAKADYATRVCDSAATHYPYALGALGAMTRAEVRQIKSAIRVYLTPVVRPKR